MKEWNWIRGGVALGIVTLLAIVLVKPIGVSTQYVITDAIVWNLLDDELIQSIVDEQTTGKTTYSSSNAYLNKSQGKYAKNATKPRRSQGTCRMA